MSKDRKNLVDRIYGLMNLTDTVIIPSQAIIGMADVLLNKKNLMRLILGNTEFPTAIGLIAEAGLFVASKPGRNMVRLLLELLYPNNQR